MARTALGMVETLGLTAAFEAADVATKAANIKLIGYEISRGGLIIVKFTGDVGAVKAAVDAAKQAASRLSDVVGAHVIPRPHKDVDNMVLTDETVGYKKEKEEVSEESLLKEEQAPEETEADSDKSDEEEKEEENKEDDDEEDFEEVVEEDDNTEEISQESDDSNLKDDLQDKDEADVKLKSDDFEEEKESNAENEAGPNKDEEDICNICGDPACPRTKGDLRKNCIHYDEIIGDDN